MNDNNKDNDNKDNINSNENIIIKKTYYDNIEGEDENDQDNQDDNEQ